MVANQLTDVGKATLRLDGQVVVDDPQRNLDQFEVVEVAVRRCSECLGAAALFDQRQREIDADANVLDFGDRVVAAGGGRGRRAGQDGQKGSPGHHADDRDQQPAHHPGCLDRYWVKSSESVAAVAVAFAVSPALI